jgi:hypothetical protein
MIADTDSTPCPPTPARIMSYFTDDLFTWLKTQGSRLKPDPEPA